MHKKPEQIQQTTDKAGNNQTKREMRKLVEVARGYIYMHDIKESAVPQGWTIYNSCPILVGISDFGFKGKFSGS